MLVFQENWEITNKIYLIETECKAAKRTELAHDGITNNGELFPTWWWSSTFHESKELFSSWAMSMRSLKTVHDHFPKIAENRRVIWSCSSVHKINDTK